MTSLRPLSDGSSVALTGAAPDALMYVDASGRIALVNAQARRLFGYRREDLIGQPAGVLVPDAIPAVQPGHRAGYAPASQPHPMGAGMEMAGHRRDGTTFPAEIFLSVIDADQGILVTAVIRNVTDWRLVPDWVRDAYLGQLAGYQDDPQPRPMGAESQLAGRRRDAPPPSPPKSRCPPSTLTKASSSPPLSAI